MLRTPQVRWTGPLSHSRLPFTQYKKSAPHVEPSRWSAFPIEDGPFLQLYKATDIRTGLRRGVTLLKISEFRLCPLHESSLHSVCPVLRDLVGLS